MFFSPESHTSGCAATFVQPKSMLLMTVCATSQHFKNTDDYLRIMWNNLLESAESRRTRCLVRSVVGGSVPWWSLNSSCTARHSGWFPPEAPSLCEPPGRYLGGGMLQRTLPVEIIKILRLPQCLLCILWTDRFLIWNKKHSSREASIMFLALLEMAGSRLKYLNIYLVNDCHAMLFNLLTYLSWILHGRLRHPVDQPLPLSVSSAVYILSGVIIRHHAPYRRVV